MCKVRPCIARCSLRWRAPRAAAPQQGLPQLTALYRSALAPGRRGVSVPDVFEMLSRLAKGCCVCYAVCGPKPKLKRLPDGENMMVTGEDRARRWQGAQSPARVRAVGAVRAAVKVTSVGRRGLRGCGCGRHRSNCRDGRCSKARESCSPQLAVSILWSSPVSGPAERGQPDGAGLAFLACRVVQACGALAFAPSSRKSKNGGRT